ncbi:MAG TPA: glycoside hydrolase family 97 catalytic domain-containing protein [Microcella sp.]|nr:glycoside hydrolase family 97 catalytic domain-containing protein [Microcella sp.]
MHALDLDADLSLQRNDRRVQVHVSAGRPAVELTIGNETVTTISLGLVVDGRDLGMGAELVRTARSTITESFALHVGKAVGDHSADHEELCATFRTADREWSAIIRLAQDGCALRYALPLDARELGAESTTLSVDSAARAWVLEYSPWYETPRHGATVATLMPGDYGFPFLVTAGADLYALVTESAINGRHSGAHAHLSHEGLRIQTADDSQSVEGGHLTPWRVVIAGSLRTIVASTLVDELASPAPASSVSPRPGRAAWSWWSSQYSGASFEVQRRFCDFAAEQGWEHLLVDCGWDPSWVPELVSYASARGIQVHLWSSWSDLDGEQALRKLAVWKSWGVAGVKVDFMESESRARYEWYDAIIAETARVGLMVNFHGSVIPRGWARTHPHVVSYEAIRGAEWYVFYGEPLSAAHNVIQPFTRNVVGSMDYTPVTFSAPRRETSDAHELALSVVFESGITHYADDPEQYRQRPLAASLLAEVPAVWDETVLLDGHPDERVVIARRSGDRWFIAGLSCLSVETTVSLDTRSLIDGPAALWVVTDQDGALGQHRHTLGAEQTTVTMAARGGFAAILAPAGTDIHRASARATVSLPTVHEPLVILTGDSALLPTSATAVHTPPGWIAERVDADTWRVAPVEVPAPGDVTVVALESGSHHGVPALSHVRVVNPLAQDAAPLMGLPFLSAHNEIGPVERGCANGGGDPRDGAPLTVSGTSFEDGIGVSQRSSVEFAIPGPHSRLRGSVAIDDETPHAHAFASIEVDGQTVATFSLRGSQGPVAFEVDVSHAERLLLRTYPGESNDEAHVDWLELQLVP